MERRVTPSVLRRRAAVPLLFAVLAVGFVGPALAPGRALLPIDNLFLYPPWQAHTAEFGIGRPHNPLIGDAILQNYSWKRFAAESYAAGELPLWNPYILGGQPFLASAQNGSLYPIGVLFSLLPLASAYAWFTALHLWLGALFAYSFARALGATRLGGIISGITFGFCGYLVVSFLWPMVVSTAIWLPALLWVIERVVQRTTPVRKVAFQPALIALGAVVVGMQFLAGHLEMSLYLLLTAGLYTAFRLVTELWQTHHFRSAVVRGVSALAMVGLGSGLAAVQLLPFSEVVQANVRGSWSDYSETIGYALPPERALGFLIPDYFGNPSHQSYLDVLDGEVRSVEHVRANREPRTDTEWGGKNYVEGTVYVGMLPLLLALIAVVTRRGGAGALAAVAGLCILLAFGSPLYAVLFYGIPGVNQLHTPFRWVYPLSLCLAVLAGLGAGALFDGSSVTPERQSTRRWAARLGGLWFVAGAIATSVLCVLVLNREWGVAIGSRALERWSDLRGGFSDGRVLFSYQYINVFGSALLMAASGLLVWRGTHRGGRVAGLAAIAFLIGDLFSFGVGFNTAAATEPLHLVPPTIEAIRRDADRDGRPFRIVTYGDDDTLPSNTNMLFGLQDVRGYDTIILREYVEYLELIEPQRGILYSKVAKLFDQRSLASPLLDLLNVRYVLTTKSVSQPGYTLLHEEDAVRVYRNERALPRAFVVSDARRAADHAAALRVVGAPAFNPRETVVIEGPTDGMPVSPGAVGSADVVAYENNRVAVRATAPSGGFLVLGDVFFEGWTATIDGVDRPVLRANGLFRAVALEPGTHEVEFRYRPLSFRIGALVSFIASIGVGLLALAAAWRRLDRAGQPTSAAGRVARNSSVPFAAGLLNKTVDVGFALIMFRVLQAEGVGAYTFAGVLVGYFDILVGFGIATLITRDVARDRTQAGRYLGNALAVRLLLWLASAALVALLVGPAADSLGIGPPLALTIWLLTVSLLPGILSGTLSALFMAYERMEYPAVVTILTTLLKVCLGVAALLSGYGYVGLAAVSLVTNVATAALLTILYLTTIGRPRMSLDRGFQRWMTAASLPLMINSLLNTLFFRIDALLLKPFAGDLALGWYSTAYKFIDGLQIIPSSFVLALFPLLSRYAESDRDKLARTYAVGLKVLLILAIPIAAGTTLLAEPIILVFAGAGFLPESARALQVLIWFLPFSFANGLTQYVLIALDRQRTITVAFVLATAFNLVANLVLIPRYGYLAAAAVTVASELVLMVPFARAVSRELPPGNLLGLAWRPALATLIMAYPVWLAAAWNTLLAIPLGLIVYALALLSLGTLNAADRTFLRRLLRR